MNRHPDYPLGDLPHKIDCPRINKELKTDTNYDKLTTTSSIFKMKHQFSQVKNNNSIITNNLLVILIYTKHTPQQYQQPPPNLPPLQQLPPPSIW